MGRASRRLRPSRLTRSVAVASTAILLTVGLTGCNRNWEVLGPYTIGLEDGQLVVAVCQSTHVTHIRLRETVRGPDGLVSPVVWEVEGEVDAPRGHVFVVGGDNKGMTNITVEDALPQAETRNYNLLFNEGDRATLSASIYVPTDGMREGEWLSPTGEVSDTPCGAIPAEP